MPVESTSIDSLLTEDEIVKLMDVSEVSDQGFDETVEEALKTGIDALLDEVSLSDEKDSIHDISLSQGLRSDLNSHEQVLLKIIMLEEEVKASKLYYLYNEEVTWGRSRSTLRKYLSEMEDEGLIEQLGQKSTLKFISKA
jgi:Fic family protein